MTNRRDILKLALLSPWLSGCGGDEPSRSELPISTPIRPDDWPTATPESQGIAASAMPILLDGGAALPFMCSILVVRNGLLVGERYYAGAQSSDLRSVASVTKTVSGLLIGQAIGDGRIASTSATLRTLLPAELAKTPNPFAAEITLQQVLDMRGGQQWDEATRQLEATGARDMTAFALALPSDGRPRGSRFQYSTATSHLLAPILKNAYGIDTFELATRNLFQPLGIAQTAWSRDESGMIHGSFGLQMRTRDLAKLAWMTIDSGRWHGRNVVPAHWLAQSHAAHTTGLGDTGRLLNTGYGNMWWMGVMAGYPVVFAWGHGGQHALLVPSLNLVIATAAELNVDYATAGTHQRMLVDLIARFLQAVKG